MSGRLKAAECRRSIHRTALKYYMQYFDMKGQNLVDSFRWVCILLF